MLVAIRKALTAFLCLLIGVVGTLTMAPAAFAIEEPVYDAQRDIAPEDGTPAPPLEMEQKAKCVVSAVLGESQFDTIPVNTVFEVNRLNQLALGRGQTVAVIDSGVSPNIRLPRLIGGGDYVMGGDGLQDCDHHGTLIAGIIAAQPQQGDAFIGVAPEATILSIRQTSGAFEPVRRPSGYDATAKAASDIHTLAESIVHAANLGATVINMSVTACYDAGTPADTSALAGALYYAAVVKNVVLVSSAGNVNQQCKQNPGPSTANPGDTKGWSSVSTVSLPSEWSQFVLSVGGATLTGEPYVNTLGGPWLGVAAPAINIVSLNPAEGDKGTLVNAQMKDGEAIPINGTSFAAAYVSGLAALVREKYPDLTAHQVINRIKKTAHAPSQGLLENLMGSGLVDPVAALTATIDPSDPVAPGVPAKGVSAMPSMTPPDRLAQTIGVYVVFGSLAAVSAMAVIALAVRAGRQAKAKKG